jgi:hypothetical protein
MSETNKMTLCLSSQKELLNFKENKRTKATSEGTPEERSVKRDEEIICDDFEKMTHCDPLTENIIKLTESLLTCSQAADEEDKSADNQTSSEMEVNNWAARPTENLVCSIEKTVKRIKSLWGSVCVPVKHLRSLSLEMIKQINNLVQNEFYRLLDEVALNDKRPTEKSKNEKQEKENNFSSKILRQPKRYTGGYDELIVFEQEITPHLLFSTKTDAAKLWFTHGFLDGEAWIISTEILFSEDNSIKNTVREYSQYWGILKPRLMALHDKRALAKEF